MLLGNETMVKRRTPLSSRFLRRISHALFEEVVKPRQGRSRQFRWGCTTTGDRRSLKLSSPYQK